MPGDWRSHPYGMEMTKDTGRGVLSTIGQIYGITLEMEAGLCILRHRKEPGERKSITVAILRCLFQARKFIATRCQSRKPSAVRDWITVINETICKEKVVYTKRGNLREFERMWRSWLEKTGSPP